MGRWLKRIWIWPWSEIEALRWDVDWLEAEAERWETAANAAREVEVALLKEISDFRLQLEAARQAWVANTKDLGADLAEVKTKVARLNAEAKDVAAADRDVRDLTRCVGAIRASTAKCWLELREVRHLRSELQEARQSWSTELLRIDRVLERVVGNG